MLDALRALAEQLDSYLAGEYGIDPDDPKQATRFERWRQSHQPFHWITEFYGVMQEGGFDISIGNPPYVELRDVSDYGITGYSCESAGNLYAIAIERAMSICDKESRLGFIVPVSSISTDRYVPLQALLSTRDVHYSSYDDRPSRLFDGLQHIRLTIHLLGVARSNPAQFCTRYNKWNSEERPTLFETIEYSPAPASLIPATMPKLSAAAERAVFDKVAAVDKTLGAFIRRNGAHGVYYSRKVGYFLQVLNFVPEVRDGNGELRPPSEFKELTFDSPERAQCALACLNSNLFAWFTTVFSDCRHLNKREIMQFPVDLDHHGLRGTLSELAARLMEDLNDRSEMRHMRFKHDSLVVQCIIPRYSKPLIDAIDRAMAQHYGLTADECDFICNYDIKYRIGPDVGESDEDSNA